MQEKQKPLNPKEGIFERWSKRGIYVPMAYDGTTGKPSVTLLGVHFALTITLVSLICLHFFPYIQVATLTSMAFYALTSTLYLIRNLQKAKFDLKDKDFELDGGDEPKQGEIDGTTRN